MPEKLVIYIKKTWTHNCSSRGIGIPTDETEKAHAYFKHAWTFCFRSRLFFENCRFSWETFSERYVRILLLFQYLYFSHILFIIDQYSDFLTSRIFSCRYLFLIHSKLYLLLLNINNLQIKIRQIYDKWDSQVYDMDIVTYWFISWGQEVWTYTIDRIGILSSRISVECSLYT